MKILPNQFDRNSLTAYVTGIRDGWDQPRYLSTSWNVEHLCDGTNDPWDAQDRGINLGQLLRSPLHHQRFNR
jgi:hypothetical protein